MPQHIIEILADDNGNTGPGAYWHDCEEGPFDSQEQAEDFAQAEVGVPWRVRELPARAARAGTTAKNKAAPRKRRN